MHSYDSMNHHAKIKGINNCPVKSESAIKAGNRLENYSEYGTVSLD